MPMLLRSKLAGVALTLGGLIAATCHVFSFESSAEVSQAALYANYAQPVHLVLFAGLVLVLLGWSVQHAMEGSEAGVLGTAAFMCLFVGITCGDLIHSILEFSAFPVIGSMAPYALPEIAEATYHSSAVGNLIGAGHCLMCIGSVATAILIGRGRRRAEWAAVPLALSALLFGAALVPQFATAISPALMPVFLWRHLALWRFSAVHAARKAGRDTQGIDGKSGCAMMTTGREGSSHASQSRRDRERKHRRISSRPLNRCLRSYLSSGRPLPG